MASSHAWPVITLAAAADEAELRIAVEDDGIGLTLVRRLVELHGGQVSAGSAGPGKGSRFQLVFPRHPAQPRRPCVELGQ